VADHDENECRPADVAPAVPIRKPWETPFVIVSAAHTTQAHVTRFTDGTSTPMNIQYGS
jgi:hypothetical protein